MLKRLVRKASQKIIFKQGDEYKLNPDVFGEGVGPYSCTLDWDLTTEEGIQEYKDGVVMHDDVIQFGFLSRGSKVISPQVIVDKAQQIGLNAQEDSFEEWNGVDIFIPIDQLDQYVEF